MPLENSVYVLFVHGLWKVVIAGMFFTSFSKNIKNLCAHRFMSLFVVGVVLTFFHSLFSSITEIGDKQKYRQTNTDGKTVKMIPNLLFGSHMVKQSTEKNNYAQTRK